MNGRILTIYGAWLAFVFTAAFVAVEWYRHIEQTTWGEVVEQLSSQDGATDA